MSDTSKATPRPWTVGCDGPSRPIILGPNGIMLSVSKYECFRWGSYNMEWEHCSLLANALNPDNPDRDKLARELAFSIQAGMGTTAGPIEISEVERDLWRDKADELLKLCEEEKP